MISVIEILVKNECLKQENVNGFIDDFAQQVKDAINKQRRTNMSDDVAPIVLLLVIGILVILWT